MSLKNKIRSCERLYRLDQIDMYSEHWNITKMIRGPVDLDQVNDAAETHEKQHDSLERRLQKLEETVGDAFLMKQMRLTQQRIFLRQCVTQMEEIIICDVMKWSPEDMKRERIFSLERARHHTNISDKLSRITKSFT